MQIMFYARNYLQKLNMQEKINFGKCQISTPVLKASIFNKMLQSLEEVIHLLNES